MENKKDTNKDEKEIKVLKVSKEVVDEIKRKKIDQERERQEAIKNMSNDGDGIVKIFSIKMNPLIIIVASIIAGLIIYGYSQNRTPRGVEVTVGEFVENIKTNKYSKVSIKDSGEAIGYSKYVDVLEGYNKNIERELEDLEDGQTDVVKLGEGLTRISLSEFVGKLETPSLKESFNAALGRSEISTISEVIIGDNYIIGKVANKNGGDFYVENTTQDLFESELARQDKDFEDFRNLIVNLTSASHLVENLNDFENKYRNKNYTDIWVYDDNIVAKLADENIEVNRLNTSSLGTDFPQFLQKEGISFQAENVDIVPETTTVIDLGLILQILSLGFIGFLVFSILRGINGGGKGLMQFGESKARMFFGKKPDVTFKDVAGIDSAKEELNEVVLFLKDPNRFLKLGARIPKGLLMVGPPGTGKTLLARAIAGEAGVPFFHTSGSEFEEMLVGAGASRVRDLFAKAKKASPALIFIDEIDAVARKRGTTIQSSSTEQTLNQILVEMDGFEKNANVIIIAATNRPDVLDPAILRPGRFDRRIVIDLPDIKGRKAILDIHAKNKPLSSNVDLNTVAKRTVGYSGADLENMLNEAAIIAAKDDRNEITPHDIEESANRVSMGRARNIERTPEELKKTAYHEAGHAIIAKLTPESDPVHRITIVSRGMALGVTMQLPVRDKYSQSYTEMESRLRVLMGGRAAEEIMYGAEKITSGASNDIEKATSIARRMVKQFGYSKKLGLVKYGESNELQYLGYGYGEQRDFSDETARIIDEEVKRVIDEAYEDSVSILRTHRELLEKISNDLMDKEVIEGEAFDSYFKDIPGANKSEDEE